MIRFSSTTETFDNDVGFSPSDVLGGVLPSSVNSELPGRIKVVVDGQSEILRFYGSDQAGSETTPVIYLAGDVVQHRSSKVSVHQEYHSSSPASLQAEANEIAVRYQRTFVHLARPGIYGSSGNHMQRRRAREVDVVNQAITRLTHAFSWHKIDLVGLSGGGHLVACLMAYRRDIRRAVIASGNLAVRQRLMARGLVADVTGYDDFVDPIEMVDRVAASPPKRVLLLTDRADSIVPARFQNAYAEKLRIAGCPVKQRYVVSKEQTHHILYWEALEAIFT